MAPTTKGPAPTASESRPAAALRTDTFRKNRPTVVGPEAPEGPFPIKLKGVVQKGFGRGGKDLGCPTANLPDESIEPMTSVTRTGIYFGYGRVQKTATEQILETPSETLPDDDTKVYPMVMSLGWNPFYKNEKLTAEIHIMHNYEFDFYGHTIEAVVLGYIRPELDYTDRESLIEDIETDKQVALKSLERPEYARFAETL